MKKFLVVWSLLVMLAPLAVGAVNLKDAFSQMLSTTGGRAGYDTNEREVEPIIGTVISVVLSFLGVIFLLLMLYGGYVWMTAAGNEEKAAKARELIIAAVIGLLIVVGAYVITVFALARFTSNLIV